MDDISTFFRHIPEKRWSLVQTRPRNEKWAQQHLAIEGIIVYLPLIKKVEMHHRSRRETSLPMFPGYLFACPNLEEESRIRRNKAVWNLKPLSLPEEESLIQDLKVIRLCELQSAEHTLVINPGLHEGDTVQVKSGAFRGQNAIVVRRLDALSVIINLLFFNRNIEMRWDAGDLEY